MKMMNLGAWGRGAAVFLISLMIVLVVTGCPEGPAGPAGPAGKDADPPPANAAPVAATTTLADIPLEVGKTITIDVGPNFSDPNKDKLTFAATSLNVAAATAATDGSKVMVTGVAAGTAVVVVTATDPGGLAAAASATVTVTDPPPTTDPDKPVAVGQIADMNLVLDTTTASKTIDVKEYFSDPNDDALVYSVTAESTVEGLVSIYIEGSMVSLTPAKEGTATVTVTATDPAGNSATQVFSVTVAKPGDPPPNLSGCSAPLKVTKDCTVTIAATQVLESEDSQRASVSRVALSQTDWKVKVNKKGPTTIRVLNSADRTTATSFVVTGKNRAPALTNLAKQYQSERFLQTMSTWDLLKQRGLTRPVYIVSLDRDAFITDADDDDLKWKATPNSAFAVLLDYMDGSDGGPKGYPVDLTANLDTFDITLMATDDEGLSSDPVTISVRGRAPRVWTYDIEQLGNGDFISETIGMRRDQTHTMSFESADTIDSPTAADRILEFIKQYEWKVPTGSDVPATEITGQRNPSETPTEPDDTARTSGHTRLVITTTGPITKGTYAAATDAVQPTLTFTLTGGLGAASVTFDFQIWYDKDGVIDDPASVDPADTIDGTDYTEAWHSAAKKTLNLNIVAVTK